MYFTTAFVPRHCNLVRMTICVWQMNINLSQQREVSKMQFCIIMRYILQNGWGSWVDFIMRTWFIPGEDNWSCKILLTILKNVKSSTKWYFKVTDTIEHWWNYIFGVVWTMHHLRFRNIRFSEGCALHHIPLNMLVVLFCFVSHHPFPVSACDVYPYS